MKGVRTLDSKPLILMVRQRPCLYDPNSKDFGNREVRAEAWEEIARSMAGARWNALGEGERENLRNDVKVRWKSLKDAYLRSLRMKNIPLAHKRAHKPYIYEKHIRFLKAFHFGGKDVKEEEAEGDFGEDSDSDSGDDEIYSFLQVGVEREEDSSTSFQGPVEDPTGAARIDQVPIAREDDGQSDVKRQRPNAEEPDPLSFLQENTSAIEFDPNTIPTYIDEDKFFLLSLLPQLKDMSQVEKLDFKIGVMQLLKANVINRRGNHS